MDHSHIALDSLRQVNKELLVVGMADVPAVVETECEAARGHVLAAIHAIDGHATDATRAVEEMSLPAWKAALEKSASKFDSILDPAARKIRDNDQTRN